MQAAYSDQMDDERPHRAIRRYWLKELLRENGGPKKLAAELGSPDTHLIACEKGRRNIGDDLATKIEVAAGKPFGWMDRPIPGAPQVQERISVAALLLALRSYLEQARPGVEDELSRALSLFVHAPDSPKLLEQINGLLGSPKPSLTAPIKGKALKLPSVPGAAPGPEEEPRGGTSHAVP